MSSYSEEFQKGVLRYQKFSFYYTFNCLFLWRIEYSYYVYGISDIPDALICTNASRSALLNPTKEQLISFC